MRSDQLGQTWTNTLVSGLRERYGLSEEDARTKVDGWLKCLAHRVQTYPVGERPVPEFKSQRLRARAATGN